LKRLSHSPELERRLATVGTPAVIWQADATPWCAHCCKCQLGTLNQRILHIVSF